MKSSISEYYNRYWTESGETYSGNHQEYASNLRAWMRRELETTGKRPVGLELGCGDGTFTRDLLPLTSSLFAVDISEAQIERNRLQIPEVDFRVHDLTQPLPFDDASLDVIWCSEVLEHLFDPAYALQQAFRVLRPGGRILVTVPYHGLLKNLLIVLFRWDRFFDPTGPHIRYYTIKSLSRLASAAGFTGIRATTCGMGRFFQDMVFPSNILLTAVKA